MKRYPPQPPQEQLILLPRVLSSVRRITSQKLTIFRNVFQRFAPFSNVASGHSHFLIGFRSASHRGKLALYNIGFDQAIYYRKVIVIDHVFHL